jgi:ABC-2 type transport system ATP-binding protein
MSHGAAAPAAVIGPRRPASVQRDTAVEARHLTKRYGRARGIEDLSFAVPAGQVFGFLGPNGAGKTTTIRTLLGLLKPTTGSAEIFGEDVWIGGVAARAQTGYLPGDFTFDERVTGEELLDLFADLRGVDDRRYARSLADRFDADLRRPIGELSHGNRQKVGLIQALVHRPRLAIMDEPTSGLDPLMQEEFIRLVAELRGDGTTVFLSSHNLPEVERMCDRVGMLRDGRLIAVEGVEAMTQRARRHVRVRLDRPVPPSEFARLPGVSDVRSDGSALSFAVTGDFQLILEALSRRRVLDVEIQRPSLEEAFIAYYGDRS